MLTDVEIVALLKKAKAAKLPEWKATYFGQIARNIQVHTKGLLFSKVDTLFPHEHPDSKAHCVNTYEPITKGSIWKAINNIVRIFSNSSFSVSASDSTLLNISAENFEGQNLFSWFVEKWTAQAIATDPNSLCVIYPPEYIDETNSEPIRFISHKNIQYVGNDMVVFISEDDSEREYSLVDSVLKREVFFDPKIQNYNAKSIVEKTYNQQLDCKIIKAVYHVFTKEYFLTFTETDGKLTYTIYNFDQELTLIPAFMLSGPEIHKEINESFISSFIPFGNLALLQHRNHRAVDLMFSYPRMSEIEVPCDKDGCNDGQIMLPDHTSTNCARCGGSGYITAQSPYKVYLKRINPGGLDDPETVKQVLASNPVDFHTPDVAILDYSKDSWKEYLSMAEEAVFIQQKQQTGNVESAQAKEIDKEGEYSWVMNISKALNSDLRRVIQSIECFINSNPAVVSLEQPISFALVTETEAFDALSVIIGSDAPIFVKSQQVENFIHKFVSKSSPVVKALKVLKVVDPLLYYSNKDVQTFKSNNVCTVDAWTMHVFAYSILMQMYENDKLLFEKPEQMIADEIIKKVALLKLPPALLKDALLNKVA